MPSRAVTSFLPIRSEMEIEVSTLCQCPLGLLPHFYVVATIIAIATGLLCQCPLGLLPHFYYERGSAHMAWYNGGVNALSGCYLISTNRASIVSAELNTGVNALSGCYLISTVPLQKPRFYAASRACFCRYLSEYSGNSCFPCMLTIWTHFMRYTYPWHCIKYSTKCSCCHPIFNNFKSLLLLFSWHPFTSSF